MSHSREYLRYLDSPAWKRIRRQVLSRARGRCERCGRFSTALEVHHRTYVRLGHEPLTDLQALDLRCHREADAARRRRTYHAVPL
jgi:5-methylcytosine-specific restriction endonuclease McrA